MTTFLNLSPTQLANALGGEVCNGQVLAPGPNHKSPRDRSLSVKLDPTAQDGFVINSFAGDDPIICKDYVREKAGLDPFKPNGNGSHRRHSPASNNKLNGNSRQPLTNLTGAWLGNLIGDRLGSAAYPLETSH
jgi:hypothetical protein